MDHQHKTPDWARQWTPEAQQRAWASIDTPITSVDILRAQSRHPGMSDAEAIMHLRSRSLSATTPPKNEDR